MNLMEQFLKSKQDNMASTLTIKNYRIDLTQVLPILFNKKIEEISIDDIRMITNLHIKNVLLNLQEKKGYTVTTINRRLASFKSFIAYFSQLHGFPNTVKNMRKFNDTRLHEIEFIQNEDVKKIINKAKAKDLEMYYVLGVLFNTGLRSAELLSLTRENVHDDCIIVVGKGNKMRRIELNSVAKECFSTYINKKGITEGRLLNISYETLRRHFTKFLKECNVDCSKLHTTRKSFATNLIEKGGVDIITDVAQLLGHSGIQTLQKSYLGSSTKKLTVSLLD